MKSVMLDMLKQYDPHLKAFRKMIHLFWEANQYVVDEHGETLQNPIETKTFRDYLFLLDKIDRAKIAKEIQVPLEDIDLL